MQAGFEDEGLIKSDGSSDAEAVLRHIIHDTNDVLAMASAVLTGDKLILTRSRLIYEKRLWFRSLSIKTVKVTDINKVTGSLSLFLGLLKFDLNTQDFPEQIGMFWRRDGIRLKRIIQGYVVARGNNVDTQAIQLERLIPLLIELGTDDGSVK